MDDTIYEKIKRGMQSVSNTELIDIIIDNVDTDLLKWLFLD